MLSITDHLPLIVVEIVMIFGGALAFAWWQFRDLDREKRRRGHAKAAPPDARQGSSTAAAKDEKTPPSASGRDDVP